MAFDATNTTRRTSPEDRAFAAAMAELTAGMKPLPRGFTWTAEDEAEQAAWRAEAPRRNLLEG